MPQVKLHLFSATASLTVLLLVSGCSQYPRHEGLSDDISPAQHADPAPNASTENTGTNNSYIQKRQFAGDIAPAMEAVDRQRSLYFKQIQNSAYGRQIAGGSLIGLSAWSVYKGVSGDTSSTKRLLALAGATGAAIYGVGTFLENKESEQAYLIGYQALTCLLVRVRPLIIEKTEFSEWSDDLAILEKTIADVDSELSVIQTKRYQEIDQYKAEGNRDPQPSVRTEFGHLYAALAKSRELLVAAHALKARVNTAGYALRRRAERVVEDVSMEVHRTEHDIPRLEGLVQSSSNITKAFSAIKPIEPSGTGADDAGAPNPAIPQASSPDGAEPAPAAINYTKASSTSGAETSLGKQVDVAVKQNSALAAKNKKLSVDNDKYKKAIEGKEKVLQAGTKVVTVDDRKALRRSLSNLYRQHRKVNLILSNFAALAKPEKDSDQCVGASGTFLTVSPSVDEITIRANQQYRFSITGNTGIPKALLVGAKSPSAEDQMTVHMTVEGDAIIVTVKVLSNLPSDTSYLVITDGSGKQRQEIALNVAKPDVKKTEEPLGEK